MHRLFLRTGILFFTATLGVTFGTGEESLQGIRGLAVVIEPLSSEIARAGLTFTDIRTDVELKLRLAGIKVLTIEESVNEPGSPWLYVNANVGLSNNFVFYSIFVELKQSARLTRDASIMSHNATTWHTATTGFGGNSRVREIRNVIKDLVDEFINAYLSVNPKK